MKMSSLLILPGVLFIWLYTIGVLRTSFYIFLLTSFQLIIAYPFLKIDANAYYKGAFDLTRKFDLAESLNYKFITDEKVFNSNRFHQLLLAINLSLLLFFLFFKWISLKDFIQLFKP
jgi:hypothetical protein